MILIDSNIIIYSAQSNFAYLRPLVMDTNNFVSAVSVIETLGFHGLSLREKNYFNSIFQVLQTLPFDEKIMNKAVEIRQQQKIKLGDSIIAATALVHGLEVYTRNVSDFQKIPGLTVVNPI